MTQRPLIIALFLVGTLALARPALAFKINDFDVHLLESASETYDSNVNFSKEEVRSDFISNLGLGLSAHAEGRHTTMDIIANFVQQLFGVNHAYNNCSEDATVSLVSQLFNGGRLSFSNSFSNTYEPKTFAQMFGLQGGRYSYLRNKLDTDFTVDILPQYTVVGRYGNMMDAPSVGGVGNSYLNSAGCELDYRHYSSSVFYGVYDFSTRWFSSYTSAFKHAAAFGLRQAITKQLFVDVKAGVSAIDSYTGKQYGKPLFAASITDQFTKRTSGTFMFNKEYGFMPYERDVFDYWQLTALLTHQLIARLEWTGSGFFGHGHYVTLDIEDDIIGISTKLSYDLGRSVRGIIQYNYTKIDSNTNARSYLRNTVNVGLSASF